MYNKKIIKHLQILTLGELEGFGKWLEIDVFNKNPEVKKLFFQLNKSGSRFSKSTLPKEDKLMKILKQKDKGEFRRTCSMLTKLLVEYIAILQLGKRTKVKNRLFLERIQRHNNDLFLAKARIERQGLSEAHKTTDRMQLLDAFLIHYMEYFTHFFDKTSQEAKASVSMMNNLIDKFYLLLKLELEGEGLSREKISADDWNPIITKDFLKYFKEQINSDSFLLLFVRTIQEIKVRENKSGINHDIFALLIDEEHDISDRRKMAIFLLNHYSRFLKSTNERDWESYFALYYGLVNDDDKILYQNNKLRPGHYLNVMSVGADLGKVNKLSSLRKNHKSSLSEENQSLEEAYWLYANKRYDEAYDEIKKIKTAKPRLLIRIYPLRLRLIYELNPPDDKKIADLIEKQLNKFEKFIQSPKNKLGVSVRGVPAFINFFRQLAHVKFNQKELKPDFFKKVEENWLVICKIWLLKQQKKGQE